MAQGRCMYRTTELGQLATEYLDDRKDEFLTLEKQIKAEMKVREADLEKIRAKVSKLGNNLRTLIRREVYNNNNTQTLAPHTYLHSYD